MSAEVTYLVITPCIAWQLTAHVGMLPLFTLIILGPRFGTEEDTQEKGEIAHNPAMSLTGAMDFTILTMFCRVSGVFNAKGVMLCVYVLFFSLTRS
jgi:hypothetical protein